MAADNSKIVYGGDMMVFASSGSTKLPLAFTQSGKMTITNKSREVGSKDSGVWTEKLSGKFDWVASSDGLYSLNYTGSTTGVDTLYAYMLIGTPINIVFGVKTGTSPSWTVDSSKKSFQGTAIITSLDINASDGDNATYSVNLEGSGALTLV
jgi:predicted secreted protein